MKRKIPLLLGASLLFPYAMHAEKRPAEKPNILFILIDDLGKEWISCYGAEQVETPVFDELARTGMQFENCYSMPQSSPSRMTLLTGQYPCTHGWINHWDVPRWGGGCHNDETANPALGRSMKEAGYVTACAGKWQLDDFRVEPDAMNKAGFDEYCMWTGYEAGVPASAERYWNPYIRTENGSRTYEGKFGADLFSDFLIDFMADHKDCGKPMFVYYPACLTHLPATTTPAAPDVEGEQPRHKAMVEYTDYIIGKLVQALDDLGIRENTVIFLTTDNGTSRQLTGIRHGRKVTGGKTLLTENGTSMPFVVNCPGTVPVTVTDALVDFTDFMPTFLELGGGSYPEEYKADGSSFAPLVLGKKKDSPRKWIMSMGGNADGLKACLTTSGRVENATRFRNRVIRDKQYKLHVGLDRRPAALFDMAADPYEQNDLLQAPSRKTDRVVSRLMKALRSMPETDNDPVYVENPPQPWDVKVKAESGIWKK